MDKEQLMNDCVKALKIGVQKASEAERDYRKLKSNKFVEAKGREGLAAEKAAWVDAECADKRYERDLAQGMVQALLEENRNYRQQMSYAQTMANVDKIS